jgi:hypothetical protein
MLAGFLSLHYGMVVLAVNLPMDAVEPLVLQGLAQFLVVVVVVVQAILVVLVFTAEQVAVLAEQMA